MNLKEKIRDLCRRKILQKKKNELDQDWNQGPSACETCMLPLRHGDIHIKLSKISCLQTKDKNQDIFR